MQVPSHPLFSCSHLEPIGRQRWQRLTIFPPFRFSFSFFPILYGKTGRFVKRGAETNKHDETFLCILCFFFWPGFSHSLVLEGVRVQPCFLGNESEFRKRSLCWAVQQDPNAAIRGQSWFVQRDAKDVRRQSCCTNQGSRTWSVLCQRQGSEVRSMHSRSPFLSLCCSPQQKCERQRMIAASTYKCTRLVLAG